MSQKDPDHDLLVHFGDAIANPPPSRFPSQIDSDRVDHANRVVYTSPKPGVPPVSTALWRPEDFATWDRQCERVRTLTREAEAAGYRVVAL